MKQFQSLRSKFIRTLLLVTGLGGVATLAIVAFTSAQASSDNLRSVQTHIEQGITSKGRVLTENHARALRGLTLDNAFLDIQRLVESVVLEDEEIVYGLYVNSQLDTLAFARRGISRTPNQQPAKDSWRLIEIPRQELLVTAESAKRTTRLGEDVLEVAVPVTDEAGDLLGTIRYGLSTRSMQDALSRATADARKRLLRSLLGVAALMLLAGLLGLALSRRQAVHITRPVAELTVAAQALATGNRAVRVKIDSGDEIELLGASFNRMVEELDSSYRALEDMNRVLEQKVEERTRELGRKNGDMRFVLDNVGQGFITLDIEGRMSEERSRVVDDWFGVATGGMTFWDYLGRLDGSVAEYFELGWMAVRDDVLPLALCLDQLPVQARKGDRTYELAYRAILEGERLDKVIVVITDVTARIERERAEQAQREMMSIFRRTMSDRTALDDFFLEASALVDAITGSDSPDLMLLRRQVHTLKGNCALFGIESVATFCHELEDWMAESSEAMSAEEKTRLRTLWTKAKDMRTLLNHAGSADDVELGRPEYIAFVADVRRRVAHDLLAATAVSWQFEPAAKRLTLLAEQIRSLADRLGRAPVDVVVTPTDLRLPPRKWGAFWSTFAHVVRNTVDHGVERVEDRVAAGKPSQAAVTLSIAREGQDVVVAVMDDGRGIDWSKIAARARALGLPSESPAELEEALFVEGVSSVGDITSISGRGVGLSAVRSVVRDLGGHIEIRTEPGRGTTFRFIFPGSMLSDSGVFARSEQDDAAVGEPVAHMSGAA